MRKFTHKVRVGTLAAALAVTALPAVARQLSPNEALDRAVQAAGYTGSSGNASGMLRAVGSERLSCVYTGTVQTDAESVPAYYVFNSEGGNGFIIASAEDGMRPVLAVADRGTIDMDNLPPSAKWWLGEYERQLKWYLDHYVPTGNKVAGFTPGNVSFDTPLSPVAEPQMTASSSWSNISPMVSTLWNQGAPYNDLCPLKNGTGGRCVTGCVATAMAQVVNYHKFAKGSGTKTYTPYGWTTTVSFDYGSWTPDWNNMLDRYSSSATSAQRTAVANLMSACGVAVEMMYGASESGAYTADVANGLKQWMGYSSQTVYQPRFGVTDDNWESFCYDALTQGYPLIYAGSGAAGGHCFVCDGYGGEGLFHINWGWGGGGPDGYYALSALDPPALGIGGGSGGFNSNQGVVVAVPGDGKHNYSYQIDVEPVVGGNLSYGGDFSTVTAAWEIYGTMENPPACYMGYRVTNAAGDIKYEQEIGNLGKLSAGLYVESNTWVQYSTSNLVNFGNGDYYIWPTYALASDSKYKVMEMVSGHKCVKVTVSGGQVTNVSLSDGPGVPMADVKFISLEPEVVYKRYENEMTVTLANQGDGDFNFSNYLCLAYCKSDSEDGLYLYVLAQNNTLKAGQTYEVKFSNDWSGLEDDSWYDFYLCTFTQGNSYVDLIDSTPRQVFVSSGEPKTDPVLVSSITVQGPTEIKTNQFAVFYQATVLPDNADDKSVTWSVDNSYCTINENGKMELLEGVTAGTVTVTATANDGSGVKGTLEVTIVEPTPDVIKVNSITVTGAVRVAPGSDNVYTATVDPEDATDKTVSWSVSGDGCTIDNTGRLTVSEDARPGTVVTITATANDGSGTTGTLDVTITTIHPDFPPTTMPEVSSHKNPKTYVVVSYRGYPVNANPTCVLNGPDAIGEVATQWSVSSEECVPVSALWYFVPGDEEGSVKICNYNLASSAIANVVGEVAELDMAQDFWIRSNGVNACGLVMSIYPEIREEACCIDAANHSLALTMGWFPSTTDWGGTTWIFYPAEVDADQWTLVNELIDARENATHGVGKTIPVSSIEVKGSETVAVGTSYKYTATVLPGGATNNSVTWSVDNTDCAIDPTGTLTVSDAAKAGKVTVTATANDGSGVKGSLEVTIVETAPDVIKVTGITVTGATSVKAGESAQYTASVTPDNADNKSVTWGVSGEDCTIDSTGKLTVPSTAKAGKVTIVAHSNDGSGVKGHLEVTIVEPTPDVIKVTGITVTGATTIEPNQSVQLTAVITPENATDKTVTWSVDNNECKVSETGKLTASMTAKAGKVTVTATANDGSGVKGSLEVTIVEPTPDPVKVTAISVSGATSVKAGESAQYTATVTPDNADNKSVTWSVSGADCTIDGTGKLTVAATAKAGKVTVTATANDGSGVKGSLEITIVEPTPDPVKVTAISVSGATSVKAGESAQYTATVTPDNADNKSVTWSVSGADCTIDGTGKLTVAATAKAGKVTVTATAKDGSGVKGSLEVTIVEPTPDPVKVTAISVSGATSVKAGESAQYTATVTPDNADNKSVTWSVSGADCTIDGTGKLTVAATAEVGTVTVTASANDGSGVKGTLEVTITKDDAVDITTVNGVTITIQSGAVIVSGLPYGVTAELYDLTGRAVATGASAGNAVVLRAREGFYVVRAAGKAYRIRL